MHDLDHSPAVGVTDAGQWHLCVGQIETEENTRGLMEFLQRKSVWVTSAS